MYLKDTLTNNKEKINEFNFKAARNKEFFHFKGRGESIPTITVFFILLSMCGVVLGKFSAVK
jgi:hypothetical protein